MISSPKNPRLKDIRRLQRCKGDRALLEGPHLVSEALAADVVIEELFATPEFQASDRGGSLLSHLPKPPTLVAQRLLNSVMDADSPRGLLAVARLPRGGVEILPTSGAGLWIYCDGLQDPGNLGALARVAEAADADGMALSPGTVHPNHPRALRASAGSLLRLPVARQVEAEELNDHLSQTAPRWACLATSGGTDLYRADLQPPLILAVGAEGPGLSDELRQRTEIQISIPLAPPVESLNATVAVAVALFELARRRR